MTDHSVRVVTWNMDHWKRTADQRRAGWSLVAEGLGADIALLQECVPPSDRVRGQLAYREIGGNRAWGTAVAGLRNGIIVTEIGTVRTRHASTRFSMLGTYPGTVMVAEVSVPEIGPITCVSVYGLIDVYAQTTMLRIVADLIPLFDSPQGRRVILGGDFNVTTATHPNNPDLKRYEAVLQAVESLGLINVVETATERPDQLENCPCGASTCHHIQTYEGHQLDWLYATPELARRCRRVHVDAARPGALSDHAPIVADFDVPAEIPDREWEPDGFLKEMAVRNGAAAGRVAEELVTWAQRRNEELQREGKTYARLDRLPIQGGNDPELWIQVDLRRPEALAYTISMRMDGQIVLQFQHMHRPPFDREEGRHPLWEQISALSGVELERRLSGRPTFPLAALVREDNLQRFIALLDDIVEQVVQHHENSRVAAQ